MTELDPQMAAVFRRLEDLYADEPDPVTVDAVEQRRLSRLGLSIMNAGAPSVAEVSDVQLDSPAGSMSARLYDPGVGPMAPGVIFIHGGGWVVCDLDTHDGVARHLALAANAKVVSIDYRLAPENKFPTPLDDCVSAVRWIAQNGAALGIDPNRLAIAGDSAGANLSLCTCLALRDGGADGSLRAGVLIYGAYEPTCVGPSYDAWGDKGYILTTERMRLFWDMYLGGRSDRDNPLAAPLGADLRSLPPFHVATADMDPLLDDSLLLLDRLRDFGQPVSYAAYDGVMHGFVNFAGLVDKGALALREAGTFLQSKLATA